MEFFFFKYIVSANCRNVEHTVMVMPEYTKKLVTVYDYTARKNENNKFE